MPKLLTQISPRMKLWLASLGPGLFVLALVVNSRLRDLDVPLAQLVAEKGPPDYLATKAVVERDLVRLLALEVHALDPLTVTQWNRVTNILAVWADGQWCRASARHFYDDWQRNDLGKGIGWYSSRQLFGEKLSVVKINEAGRVTEHQRVPVSAVATHMSGFERPPVKPPE